MAQELPNQHDAHSRDVAISRHAETRRGNVATNEDGTTTHRGRNSDAGSTAAQINDSARLYTLSIPEVRKMLVESGHVVSERTLLRWCARELLDAVLRTEENGQYEKYYVNRGSVIEKIDQLDRVRPTTAHQKNGASNYDPTTTEDGNVAARDNRSSNDKKSIGSDPLDSKKEIQNLRYKIQILDVDIQVKEKLLIREKEATRDAWNKIAEVGEQAGEWKAKYEQLKLAAPIPPQNDSDNSNYREVEFTATSDPAQTKADIPKKGELNSTVSNEARDNRKAVNPRSRRVKKLNHALIYAILAALAVLLLL